MAYGYFDQGCSDYVRRSVTPTSKKVTTYEL